MQFIPRFVTVFTLVAALGVSGCSNLSPEGNAGIAAGIVGAATGIALGCAGVRPEITIPVALGAAALVGGATYIYAKHQATVKQQRIAEERAKLYFANLDAQKKAKVGRYLAVKTSSTSQTKGQPIMLYDTISGATVGDTVYDVKSTPATGAKTALDSTEATYIGGGQ